MIWSEQNLAVKKWQVTVERIVNLSLASKQILCQRIQQKIKRITTQIPIKEPGKPSAGEIVTLAAK
jgi:hypothetical protein